MVMVMVMIPRVMVRKRFRKYFAAGFWMNKTRHSMKLFASVSSVLFSSCS